MKIYLLFLFAILITCRANEVSWSRQPNANSGFRRNDLNINRGGYLDGGGGYSDRTIGRTAYIGRAGLKPVYVGRTNGFNDNSYEKRASYPSRGDNVRAVTPLTGQLPSGTKSNTSAWRVRPNKGADVGPASAVSNTNLIGKATLARASKVDKDNFVWNPSSFGNEPTEGRVVRQTRNLLLSRASGVDPVTHFGSTSNIVQGVNLETSDLKRAGGYGQGNYISRPDGLQQVDNVARINVSRTVIPIVRDGNYINELDGIGHPFNVGRTSHLDRSAPVVRAGSYSQETYVNNANGASQGLDVARGDLNYDINKSDSLSAETQVSRHVYSHSDPESERNQLNPYVQSFRNTAGGNAAKGINISDRGSTGNLNNGFGIPSNSYSYPNDGNGVFNNYRFLKNGYDYDAPYEGYGNPNDGSYIPNSSFGVPNNRFRGLDYNMLAPDFYKFADMDANSNSSITDKKFISNRGGIFDGDYSMSHRLTHYSKVFPYDKNDATSIVKISNNNTQMKSNGDCYCNTNNGQRVCTCDHNHLTTACKNCKVRETIAPKPIICNQHMIKKTLPPPPPPPSSSESGSCKCGYSTSCCCKHSCHCGNSCSNICCSEPKKPTYNHCCDYSEHGHSYYGGNGYNDYNNLGGGEGKGGGGAGAQVHTVVDGGAWGGVYGGGSSQITGHGHSASTHSGIGSNGGIVALNTDIKSIDDTNALLSSSKSYSSNNGVQISGGSSSAAANVYSSSNGYGGGSAYKKFLSSFGNGSLFSKKIFQGGGIFGG